MIRLGEDFWLRAIEQQRLRGLNATRFCNKTFIEARDFSAIVKGLANQGMTEGLEIILKLASLGWTSIVETESHQSYCTFHRNTSPKLVSMQQRQSDPIDLRDWF
jgi:hypothetical protein